MLDWPAKAMCQKFCAQQELEVKTGRALDTAEDESVAQDSHQGCNVETCGERHLVESGHTRG